ncbi:SUF system NifU family Fe-S cluster assembly protein [archaeon 13_1_20CM_2_54_9]|nr:MAG: SUF system NifU family Fe-S cluster assembly protein [Crenarchaeota archaeon 13_1_40CM_3_53_5]OLE75183.1 MAG: SUF system NifU family Fe-S cluster assembly protein [archaeon 13_1_20CM_2_54_9]TMI27057.1 MAG: SUF system NifU family Fe-S cluster assembly protein [Candidatus Bathyarchaeota archaeon]TMI30793.1 MAG: SUF system NifU family Fe-S cluster assembly protein [Candidatus Bathyarchaeota archaeon]
MSSIYSEIILDYYRNPRNKGKLDRAQIRAKDTNPLCGDVIEIQMELDGDSKVKDIRFNGMGCAISQASASMLTELVKGKSLDEARKISKEDILSLIGGQLSAVRLKCALLSLKVMKTGLYNYIGSLENAKEELSSL